MFNIKNKNTATKVRVAISAIVFAFLYYISPWWIDLGYSPYIAGMVYGFFSFTWIAMYMD